MYISDSDNLGYYGDNEFDTGELGDLGWGIKSITKHVKRAVRHSIPNPKKDLRRARRAASASRRFAKKFATRDMRNIRRASNISRRFARSLDKRARRGAMQITTPRGVRNIIKRTYPSFLQQHIDKAAGIKKPVVSPVKIPRHSIWKFFNRKIRPKVLERSARKLSRFFKRRGFAGLESDDISFGEAEAIATSSLHDELSGLPMPEYESDGLGNFISKAFKKVKSAVSKVGKKIVKVVKKVAPIVLAAAAIYFGGPYALAAVKSIGATALAVGKTVATTAITSYAKAKMMGQPQVVQQGGGQVTIPPGRTPEQVARDQLPIGVTIEQAEMIVKGKLPPGVSTERAQQIVYEAKLIAQGMTPEQAHAQYAQEVAAAQRAQIEQGPSTSKSQAELAAEAERKKREAISRLPYDQQIAILQNEQRNSQKAIENQQQQIINAVKSTPGSVQKTDEQQTAQTIQSPSLTNTALQFAKDLMAQKGIQLKSEQAQKMMELEIAQAQQAAAEAASKGQVYNPPVYQPQQLVQPEIRVVRESSGGDTVQVAKEPSNSMLPMLAMAAPLLLMALK